MAAFRSAIHVKNATDASMRGIRMLSGLPRAFSTRFSSVAPNARNAIMRKPIAPAIAGFVTTRYHLRVARNAATASVRKTAGFDSAFRKSFRPSIRGPFSGSVRLHRPADAAVLAHAPEVHGHQDHGREGDGDAVEHVEAEQGRLAHEPPRQQGEPDVGAGGDEGDVADLEELRAHPVIGHEGPGAEFLKIGELVPGEE